MATDRELVIFKVFSGQSLSEFQAKMEIYFTHLVNQSCLSQRSGLNSDNFNKKVCLFFFLNQVLYLVTYTRSTYFYLFFICICCQPDQPKWS